MQDLRIAMVQMNSRVAEHERNLATIARFTEQAAAQDVDIVCFPELCVCGYSVGDPSTLEPEPLRGDSLRRLEVISGDHEITVLAGFLEPDLHRPVHGHLPEPPVSIDDRSQLTFLKDFDLGIRDDVTLLDRTEVLWDADESVRIVTRAIGIGQQLGHEPGIFRRCSGGCEHPGDGLRQLFLGEAGHGGSFSSQS